MPFQTWPPIWIDFVFDGSIRISQGNSFSWPAVAAFFLISFEVCFAQTAALRPTVVIVTYFEICADVRESFIAGLSAIIWVERFRWRPTQQVSRL